MHDFYEISPPLEKRWWWFELDRSITSRDPKAPSRLMKGQWERHEIVHLSNMEGDNRTDMAGNTMGVPLVSMRLLKMLKAASKQELVGLSCTLHHKDGSSIIDEPFCILDDIPIGCGPIDPRKGANLLSTDLWRTDPWLTNAVGLEFDPASWSGASVFFAANTRSQVFVYKTLAQKLIAGELDGVVITPLPDVGRKLRDALVEDHKRTGLI